MRTKQGKPDKSSRHSNHVTPLGDRGKFFSTRHYILLSYSLFYEVEYNIQKKVGKWDETPQTHAYTTFTFPTYAKTKSRKKWDSLKKSDGYTNPKP